MVGRPGIAHRAEVSGGGGVAHGEFMHVGFAENDGSGAFQSCGDEGVFVGDAVVKDLASGRGACAGGVDVVLEDDGQAMQGAAELAGFGFGVELLCLGKRVIMHDGDEGVEFGIVDLDALEIGLGESDGGKLVIAHALRGFDQGEAGEW